MAVIKMKQASGAIAKMTIVQRRCQRPLLQDANLVELLVMNSHQSSPILSFSKEEVIINSSRSDITKKFNFLNCNVNKP